MSWRYENWKVTPSGIFCRRVLVDSDFEGKHDEFTLEDYAENPDEYAGAPPPPPPAPIWTYGRWLYDEYVGEWVNARWLNDDETTHQDFTERQYYNDSDQFGDAPPLPPYVVDPPPDYSRDAQVALVLNEDILFLDDESVLADEDVNESLFSEYSKLDEISSAVVQILESSTSGHQLQFNVKWDFFGFCKAQLSGNREISRVPIVVGSLEESFVTTCEEYFQFAWPGNGLSLLKFFETNVSEHDSSVFSHGNNLSATFTPVKSAEQALPYFTVYANGDPDLLIALVQQLALMSVAFKSVDLLHESFQTDPQTPPKLDVSMNPFISSVSETMVPRSFEIETTLTPSGFTTELPEDRPCWHYLFRNFVLAANFPMPARRDERGVELSFELMCTLSRVRYPLQLSGVVVLKGFSTALIPVAQSDSSVQWHFMKTSGPEEHITLEAIQEYVVNRHCNIDSDKIQKSSIRHFLGVWKEVDINLGTAESGYDRLLHSGADKESESLALGREGTMQIGSSGLGIFGAQASLNMQLPNAVMAQIKGDDPHLFTLIAQGRSRAAIIYDLDIKTGFLVPELSLVYHTMLARLHNMEAKWATRIPRLAAVPDGAGEAEKVLKKHCGNEVVPKLGNQKSRTIEEIFRSVWDHFQGRKEAVASRILEYKQFKKTVPLKKGPLLGWDYNEIALDERRPSRRQVALEEDSGGWESIARHYDSNNGGILIVFWRMTSGAAINPIRPHRDTTLCDYWQSAAPQKSYLVISLLTLIRHSMQGSDPSQTRPLRITNHHYCGMNPAGDPFASCILNSTKTCNRLLQLSSDQPRRPLSSNVAERNGAIVIGKNKLTKRSCQQFMQSPPQLIRPSNTPALPVTTPQAQRDPVVGISATRQPAHHFGLSHPTAIPETNLRSLSDITPLNRWRSTENPVFQNTDLAYQPQEVSEDGEDEDEEHGSGALQGPQEESSRNVSPETIIRRQLPPQRRPWNALNAERQRT